MKSFLLVSLCVVHTVYGYSYNPCSGSRLIPFPCSTGCSTPCYSGSSCGGCYQYNGVPQPYDLSNLNNVQIPVGGDTNFAPFYTNQQGGQVNQPAIFSTGVVQTNSLPTTSATFDTAQANTFPVSTTLEGIQTNTLPVGTTYGAVQPNTLPVGTTFGAVQPNTLPVGTTFGAVHANTLPVGQVNQPAIFSTGVVQTHSIPATSTTLDTAQANTFPVSTTFGGIQTNTLPIDTTSGGIQTNNLPVGTTFGAVQTNTLPVGTTFEAVQPNYLPAFGGVQTNPLPAGYTFGTAQTNYLPTSATFGGVQTNPLPAGTSFGTDGNLQGSFTSFSNVPYYDTQSIFANGYQNLPTFGSAYTSIGHTAGQTDFATNQGSIKHFIPFNTLTNSQDFYTKPISAINDDTAKTDGKIND